MGGQGWSAEAGVGNRRTVLITGASRGIGRACARELRRLGFDVMAGVRNESDGLALARELGPGVVPVTLDVTRRDQVARAADAVRARVGERGLYGLVNNAGIVVAGPLEFLPPDALREQFDVNFFGLVDLTQALFPDLRRAGGRIVNVSSLNGRLVTPFSGAYCASKFALEAVSDAWRRELRGAVGVVVVQPGPFRTDIWGTSRDLAVRLAQGYPDGARRYYGGVLARLAEVRAPERAGDPAAVARVVGRALTARRPRPRYPVGNRARLAILLAAIVPTRLLDALLVARVRRRSA
jgi:NAD(P)-dependent dehydrogenase (short-subunit alcohol dehydrogenase family)